MSSISGVSPVPDPAASAQPPAERPAKRPEPSEVEEPYPPAEEVYDPNTIDQQV